MQEEFLITKEGYSYSFDPSACNSCEGACCTGESGYIWVKYNEIESIAKYLNISVDEFANNYLKKVGHRYSLTEKVIAPNNYACIFFDESINRCTIYPVRPKQCITFPFWEQYKNNEDEVKKECPGVK